MRIIIAGSRTIGANLTIEDLHMLDEIVGNSGFDVTEVVCGMAKGADLLGMAWAKLANVAVTQFPANWDHYGKRAGYIRNIEMSNHADGLIALWDGGSRGTRHMIEIMTVEKRLPTFIAEIRNGEIRERYHYGQRGPDECKPPLSKPQTMPTGESS